jgi:hypothetical protein
MQCVATQHLIALTPVLCVGRHHNSQLQKDSEGAGGTSGLVSLAVLLLVFTLPPFSNSEPSRERTNWRFIQT